MRRLFVSVPAVLTLMGLAIVAVILLILLTRESTVPQQIEFVPKNLGSEEGDSAVDGEQLYSASVPLPHEHEADTGSRETIRYGKPILEKDIVIVYNRIPKCGSRTLLSLAEVMARRHGYRKPRPIIPNTQPNKYGIVKSAILAAQSPILLEGHVQFIDLKNDSKRVFINLIRNPLDRMVSQYYFTRHGDSKFTDLKKLHKLTKPTFINESFDECVLRDRPACVNDQSLTQQLRHFCGYHPQCSFPSRWAVEEAKRNMDRFLLVGVTEEYDDTLRVLERLAPALFGGMVQEYHRPKQQNVTFLTQSKLKVPPSTSVINIMREKLKYEFEVYEYAVQKFHRLKEEILI